MKLMSTKACVILSCCFFLIGGAILLSTRWRGWFGTEQDKAALGLRNILYEHIDGTDIVMDKLIRKGYSLYENIMTIGVRTEDDIDITMQKLPDIYNEVNNYISKNAYLADNKIDLDLYIENSRNWIICLSTYEDDIRYDSEIFSVSIGLKMSDYEIENEFFNYLYDFKQIHIGNYKGGEVYFSENFTPEAFDRCTKLETLDVYGIAYANRDVFDKIKVQLETDDRFEFLYSDR